MENWRGEKKGASQKKAQVPIGAYLSQIFAKTVYMAILHKG